MKITFLGHAGFCVENEHVTIIMDPWLSPYGAYDSAWFQLPSNHHLIDFVTGKLNEKDKEKYLYISHEHKDHFDPAVLKVLSNDFTFIIGDFRREVLKVLVTLYPSKGIIACNDREKIPIPGGYIRLFLDDTELNRDSAILVSLDNTIFLNFNDCKKVDEIPNIINEDGNINVFACQYSGATWHPTCYDYDKKEYEAISKRKMFGKFESVARAIEAANPEVYLPSAGPPCFLDPVLYSINFEAVNIFPGPEKLTRYLEKRLKNKNVYYPIIMPGDALDTGTKKIVEFGTERVDEDSFKNYIESYAAKYKNFFSKRKLEHPKEEIGNILEKLKKELEEKLANLSLSSRISAPMYFILYDNDKKIIRVDFNKNKVEFCDGITDDIYYSISAPSWEVARVLDRIITWDDFSLTFRMKLNRKPDVYQKIIEAYLVLEKEDLNEFCKKLLEMESQKERVVIEAGGCRYSIDRFCPHEGGDLQQSWIEEDRYLVCPRHTWKYDLFNEGKCTTNDTSINVIILEND